MGNRTRARRLALTTATATLALSTSFTAAVADGEAQLPAVSAPNGKLRVGGFGADGSKKSDEGLFEVRGSYTAPITYSTGFQIDGVIASVNGGDDNWGALAGHYFWRDPDDYLIGLYGEVDWLGEHTYGTIAAEGELYLGRFTLTSVTGIQVGDFDTSFLTNSYVNFYPDDDVLIGVGFRNDHAGGFFQAKAEYQAFPDHSGMTLFADGQFNDDDTRVFAGVKFHFGQTKSLIRRHREDDPGEDTPNPLVGLEDDPDVVAPPAPAEVD